MKIFLIFAGIIAFSCAHSIPLKKESSRIINGVNVELGEIPYIVSIRRKYDNLHICGGSIINSKYVLTTAYCFVPTFSDEVRVIAATTNNLKPVETYNVEKVIKHPEYNKKDSMRNDIALIKIEGEFVTSEFLKYIQLAEPDQKIPAGSRAIVSGWGSIDETGVSESKLKKNQIYIVEQETCEKMYTKIKENIYDTHICASDPVKGTSPCFGDFGGPLAVDGKLVGIASWSHGCGNPLYPAVFTRVSQYHDWIEANTE